MVGLCYIMSAGYSFITGIFLVQPFSLFLLSAVIASIIVLNMEYIKEIWETYLSNNSEETPVLDFDYGWMKGPCKWKEYFPAANGSYQSPINIQTDAAEILRISEPLLWYDYEELPEKVFIENTGHSVVLRAQFNTRTPRLSGADLVETYEFISICFHWSFLDDEGSEHSINDKKYPLEMQAKHQSKKLVGTHENFSGDIGILMLSYFFAITKFDNAHLDPIILNLCLIREPFKKVEIAPFPISWLCYPYKSGFYSYGGSLTEPPCSEGVTWFVQHEPLAISGKQLAEFRLLLSRDGKTRILKNSRPVQNLNSRVVCFNRYDQFSQLSSDIGAEGTNPGVPEHTSAC